MTRVTGRPSQRAVKVARLTIRIEALHALRRGVYGFAADLG